MTRGERASEEEVVMDTDAGMLGDKHDKLVGESYKRDALLLADFTVTLL